MMSRILARSPIRRTSVALTALLVFHHVASAQARLPRVDGLGAPDDGNYMTLILFVVGLGIGVAAALLAGSAFLEVAGGIIAKFNEWRTGRAEAGDLKKIVVGGAVVLAIIILLVTIAAGVIDSSSTIVGR